jgi:subtilisin family serine protease
MSPSWIMIKSVFAFLCGLFIFSTAAGLDTKPQGRFVSDKVVVKQKANNPGWRTNAMTNGYISSGDTSIDRICREVGVINIEPYYPGPLTKPALARAVAGLYIFTIANPDDIETAIAKLSNNPNIDYIERISIPQLNYSPDDPAFPSQWHLPHVHADNAWDIVRGDTTRHSVIAVVDAGINYDHPDLLGNIWVNPGEDINQNGQYDSSDYNNIDDDHNGFIDDLVGWDWGTFDNNPMEEPSWPHGTSVAGCVSEVTDNGVWGSAIGFSARMMCIKVFNAGNLHNVMQGLLWAVENNARIINISWGTPVFSQTEQNVINAIWDEDVLIVASAGNESSDVPIYPAAYDNVIAVAATDANDHLAPFSGYGSWIDLCAPGTNILTTETHSGFASYNGTSFSAAMVSGLAGLIRAWYPSMTNAQIENLIKSTTDNIDSLNPGYIGRMGTGRLNAFRWLLTSIDNQPPLAHHYYAIKSYPNPFNSSTLISYTLNKRASVKLTIYDLLGKRVASAIDYVQEAGDYRYLWDGTEYGSGIYFARLEIDSYSETIKLCLIR